ncbi:hypothetical protein HDU89_007603, partial [Geranomyces variabilis]
MDSLKDPEEYSLPNSPPVPRSPEQEDGMSAKAVVEELLRVHGTVLTATSDMKRFFPPPRAIWPRSVGSLSHNVLLRYDQDISATVAPNPVDAYAAEVRYAPSSRDQEDAAFIPSVQHTSVVQRTAGKDAVTSDCSSSLRTPVTNQYSAPFPSDGGRADVFSSDLQDAHHVQRTPDRSAVKPGDQDLHPRGSLPLCSIGEVTSRDVLGTGWPSPPRTPRDSSASTCDKEDADFFSQSPLGTERGLMPDVDQADLARGIKSVIRFKCYTLQNYDMTPLNHTEFHGLRTFFSAPYEPRRGNSRPRNEQTIAKSRERICGFLGWLKQSGRFSKPSFVNFEDIDLFLDKYVEGYLRAIRGLSYGSIANHITAAIDVLKYRSAETCGKASAKPKGNLKIARLMRTRNQEQTLAERQRIDTKQDSTTSGIVWEQVLEAVRWQRLIVNKLWENCGGGDLSYELTAETQHYVALAFYTSMPPGRSKEIRFLLGRVLLESESQESLQNHITMIQGRHVAVVSDYKNKQRWGRDTIELPKEREVLVEHLLWLMTPNVRQRLTRDDDHGFLFCKRNSASFAHASEWTAYLSGIVSKHTGIAGVSTNALRHAFTTFMETSSEEDHQRLRESVGRAIGVEFATHAFKRAVIHNNGDDDLAERASITPPIGSIVGFRDAQAGSVFGKVLRIASGDVLVMILRATATSGVVTPDATRVLRKSITEIAWPTEYES